MICAAGGAMAVQQCQLCQLSNDEIVVGWFSSCPPWSILVWVACGWTMVWFVFVMRMLVDSVVTFSDMICVVRTLRYTLQVVFRVSFVVRVRWSSWLV